MDFFLAEVECGTSTLAAVVVNAALAHGRAAGDKHATSVNRVYLVSRAGKNKMETRPSLPFRLEQAKATRARLQPLVSLIEDGHRALRREASDERSECIFARSRKSTPYCGGAPPSRLATPAICARGLSRIGPAA